MSALTERPAVDERPYVSLAEALTWIAFGKMLSLNDLQKQVEGEPAPTTGSREEQLRVFFAGTVKAEPKGEAEPGDEAKSKGEPEAEAEAESVVPGTGFFEDRQLGLDRLAKAWAQLRAAIESGRVRMRGRYTDIYTIADTDWADEEYLDGVVLATFSQFDVSLGGIRRKMRGSTDILWNNHPESFNRELEAAVGDERSTGGYLQIEVERAKLPRSHHVDEVGRARSNRQLNHQDIRRRAANMLRAQPGLSKGSAAASIVAELKPNPRSGKQRDKRHIERMIADIWEGDSHNPPP